MAGSLKYWCQSWLTVRPETCLIGFDLLVCATLRACATLPCRRQCGTNVMCCAVQTAVIAMAAVIFMMLALSHTLCRRSPWAHAMSRAWAQLG